MRCAVLGDPIDHSLSPVLHAAAYATWGLDWTYEAIRVPSGTLPDFVATLDSTWRGVSMTMPLKREVLALVADHSPRVRLAGAANTLVVDETGLRLDNTDLPGAALAVQERYPDAPKHVTILGGGATAASTGLGMCDLGARSVRLLTRTPAGAAEAAAAIASHPSKPKVAASLLGAVRPRPCGDVVISTIPAAAQTSAVVAATADATVIFDVLYHPWPTPLATAATERGQVLVSGLDLLVHQAALQVELFCGRVAPLEVMRQAGLDALAARATGPGEA